MGHSVKVLHQGRVPDLGSPRVPVFEPRRRTLTVRGGHSDTGVGGSPFGTRTTPDSPTQDPTPRDTSGSVSSSDTGVRDPDGFSSRFPRVLRSPGSNRSPGGRGSGPLGPELVPSNLPTSVVGLPPSPPLLDGPQSHPFSGRDPWRPR